MPQCIEVGVGGVVQHNDNGNATQIGRSAFSLAA